MKNKSKAFSLLELSIVVLIIGVLIAGVTQASRLVRQSKLTTARTLTQSSAVNSMSGLLVWLEPTQESSFKSTEASDGTTIEYWYDSNPQVPLSNTFRNGTGTPSSTITYKASATNSLPAVAFASNNTAFTGTVLSSNFSSYTIFYVVRPTSVANTSGNTIFYNGVSGTDGFGVKLTTTNGYTQFAYGTASTVSGTSSATANQNSADIVCITVAPSSVLGSLVSTPNIFSYKNGVADISSTITTANWVAPTTAMYVGNATTSSTTNDFVGEISEIIIFDNVLKKSDRQEVEKYLSKKYAISITQN